MHKYNGIVGDSAELLFAHICARRKIEISIPFGSYKYDMIVRGKKELRKIQIKHTATEGAGDRSYRVTFRSNNYLSDDVDFFAIYVEPEQTWFIIPFEEAPGIELKLSMGCKNHKYKQYEEAWELL